MKSVWLWIRQEIRERKKKLENETKPRAGWAMMWTNFILLSKLDTEHNIHAVDRSSFFWNGLGSNSTTKRKQEWIFDLISSSSSSLMPQLKKVGVSESLKVSAERDLFTYQSFIEEKRFVSWRFIYMTTTRLGRRKVDLIQEEIRDEWVVNFQTMMI